MIRFKVKKCAALFLAAALLGPCQPVLRLWAAEQASLSGIDVQPDQLTIHLSDQVRYNTFITADPPRLVIELLDTEYQAAAKMQPGEGLYLKRVRSGQYQREPRLISRIVLDLVKLVGYRAKWVGSRLLVSLAGASGEPAETPEVEATAVQGAALPPAPEPVAPPPPAPKNVTLDKVEVQPDRVAVTLSEPRKFNSFIIPKPPRLILEFKDTEYKAGGRLRRGQGRILTRVRGSQFERAPKMVSRVVMDLKRVVGYKAKWEGGRLLVSLTPPVEKPAPVRLAKKLRDAPALPASKPAVLPKTMTTTASSELTRMGRRRKSSARGRRRLAKHAAEARLKKKRRDILGSLPTDPITLDFDNTDIQDILKLLATKSKVNMVYGSDVTGTLTLHLADVPFNEAFMTILSMQGLVPNQVGSNILRVMTPSTLTQERASEVTQTKVIRLRYAKADEILATVSAVRGAEKRTGPITTDKNLNALIVTDSIEGIASVERLLAEIDVRPLQVMIEAKLVEVQLTKDLALGVQWDYLSNDLGKALGSEGNTLIGTLEHPQKASSKTLGPLDANINAEAGAGATGRGTGVNLPASKIFGAFTFGRITNNYFLSATLTAAASQGKAKVLSDPKITVINGEKAKIEITTQIPFVTSETNAGGGTAITTEKVEYTETGIVLEVEPTVNADSSIFMKVKPKVSQRSNVVAAAGSTGAISTDQRAADTSVLVQNGGTIVIGGIITDRDSNQIAKVPLLGDIPLVGWLFKKKFVERNRVELLIFVTAKVVED